MKTKYIFVDYEGTLAEVPSENLDLNDLLFGDVFSDLKPNKRIKNFLLNQNDAQIFVLGVVDTNREIELKIQWLKRYYPFIPESNYIFISSEHRKVDVLDSYLNHNHWQKGEVILIDDKEKHLLPARKAGFTCIKSCDIL